jgi:hypothetical protein
MVWGNPAIARFLAQKRDMQTIVVREINGSLSSYIEVACLECQSLSNLRL